MKDPDNMSQSTWEAKMTVQTDRGMAVTPEQHLNSMLYRVLHCWLTCIDAGWRGDLEGTAMCLESNHLEGA